MERIHVEVSKPYDILIDRGMLQSIPNLINPVCASNRIAIVTDDIVANLYLRDLQVGLSTHGFETVAYVFPNGEQSKNINTLSGILEFLAENHIRRNDTLIALGGGVVGDITGLAAAMYMRGVSIIQIPTTLLAAVDSSVGGKTAIDLRNGKNLAGAFWQPSMVVCDVDVIQKLPADIFAEGMAEVIKCNVIKDLPIIRWIETGALIEHLEETIYECISLKRNIVEQDEFDTKGIRNILNVGHTVAHAIEKLSGYTISHGHAVGTGLIVEAELANKLGWCDREIVERIRTAVEHYCLSIDISWSSTDLSAAMKSDKKNRDAGIVFELPCTLGECKEIKLETDLTAGLIGDICGGYGVNEY